LARRRKRKRRRGLDPDDDRIELSPRAWVLLSIGSVLLAIPGVLIYAANPGVGTYQANGVLILPLVCLVGYGLHKALPVWLQWLLAVLVAPVGSVVYLLHPDAQWWNYGPLSAAPLVALVTWRVEKLREERGEPASSSYGGFMDGPWGPP
jgi:hypothetical protein